MQVAGKNDPYNPGSKKTTHKTMTMKSNTVSKAAQFSTQRGIGESKVMGQSLPKHNK